jgi:Ca2+-transporting ATPase
VVVATGPATELGMIQALAGEARPPETPMERQLDHIGRQMVWLSSGICAAVGVVGLLRGSGFVPMLKTAISLAVAAVPEGLPAVATTTLALGIRDMGRHDVLIRKLNAVETLGSVQTLCFDKTGTITLNRMTVVRAYTGMRRFDLDRNGFHAVESGSGRPEELRRLMEIGALCNETEIEVGSEGPKLKGSPTEQALIEAALLDGLDVADLRTARPLLRSQPRAEGRNYMASVHRLENGQRLVAVKGSPDQVLGLSDSQLLDGRRLPLDEATRQEILTENERMAGRALRVLGAAYTLVDEEVLVGNGDPATAAPLTWVGMTGMTDPLRPGMPELVQRFHRAGLATTMITGDQSTTAYAIGRELHLNDGDPLEILDSNRLETLDPQMLEALAQRVHVFSRVSPAHKLKIVQALQQAGRIVAMTGDGINDGPALKAADIGVAMGEQGTETARNVADVVLRKDDLHTMITAVSKGRAIYDNIRKAIHFLLATNLTEIEVVFLLIALGLAEPLTPIQLLWINLISDIFPGLALAIEPPEPDNLNRPPRDPKQPILDWSQFGRMSFESAVISGGALAALGYGIGRYGMGPQARSLLFSSLVTGQLLHALSCRSDSHGLFSHGRLPRNPYLELALGGSLAAQLAATVTPALRRFLGLTPLGPLDGLVAVAGGVAPLLINEATKGIGRRGEEPK